MPCGFDALLVRSLDWDSKRSRSLGFLARSALCNIQKFARRERLMYGLAGARKRRLRPVPDGIRAVGMEKG
jgi:hypothetical protein